jgi:competence protein ComEC
MVFLQKIQDFSLRFWGDERERFVLWLPVLLALGITAYFLLPYEPETHDIYPFLAALALVLKLIWRRVIMLRYLLLALLVVILGFIRADSRTAEVAAPVLSKSLFFKEVSGQIYDIQLKESKQKLYLSDVAIEGVSQQVTPVRLSVSLRKVNPELQVGDKVSMQAMLFPPPSPSMPGSYDFARMFYYDQIGAVGYAPGAATIVEKVDPQSFEQRLNKFRLALTERILAPMSAENGWIAAAMMTGEMSGVSKESADAMRDAGIYHVLSISGLHMSIAAALMFFSLRFLLCLYPPFALRYPVKKIAAVLGLIGSFAYLLVAGYPTPAVRSFIMVACVMMAILCNRQGISVYSMAWAGTVILLWQPEALLGASFQLSFAATLGIVSLYERYGDRLHISSYGVFHKLWVYLFGVMLTSLVATAVTTPYVLYHFNRFTLWGIVANMLLLPLVSFWIMPVAVIAFLMMPLGAEAWPLHILEQGIALMVSGSRFIAGLPLSSIAFPPPSLVGMIVATLAGLWLCLWRSRMRLYAIPFIVFGVGTAAFYKPYDLLVSDDGKRVAVYLESVDGLVFLRGRDTSFDADLWLRLRGKDKAVAARDVSSEILSCDKLACRLQQQGKLVVIAKGKKTEGLCAGEPYMVISSEYLDRKPECAAIPLLVDKAYLRKHGAVAVRFGSGEWIVDSAAVQRGERPWVRGYSAKHFSPADSQLQSTDFKGNNAGAAGAQAPQDTETDSESTTLKDLQ